MSTMQEWVGAPSEPRQVIDDRSTMFRDDSLGASFGFEVPPGLPLADLVKAAVLQTLARLDGNRTQAAHCLGISVRTLQRKLKQWHREYHPRGNGAVLDNEAALDEATLDHEAGQFQAAMR